ncbi:Schwann cell myelin protein-like [Symphorus nematophorus]
MIFYEDNTKVQSGFRGRVSLLEPDISHKNCSIIINDLTESDSGSYQFRVYGNRTGFMFRPRATVSVKGLTQKPKVMISVPLTEGQQTTLTCTAPGLCSGSDPEITWTWRGRGENDSHITGNITAFKTESLTAVSKRHSSTLTFNLSATQHHCTVVTCKVSFSNNITTEETVTLSITDPVQQCGSCSAVLPWVITAVSLIVNVICIICVLFLWNTRKKVKSSQEDRTYMSLRKTELSSEYEVIERRLKCASLEGTTDCQLGFCITLNEEITAEAGLCVVIPCSFTLGSGFTPQTMVWHKCEPSKQRCDDTEKIFHTYNRRVQSGFRGRVSPLEPDLGQWNCSIIINDLTESDSGSYQLRVNGYNRNWASDGFLYPLRTTVSVKGLTQKPTVMIPVPLTEGQQTTLTCTAPGLCSGSDPEITWTWRGRGEKDSHITGNITAFKTESLTAVTGRHSSTLTFYSSAEHHGTNVTCKVSFRNNITTEETVTLSVTYVKEVKITGNASVKEGETLNLTCSVKSFPPSLITWSKFSNKSMQNGTEINLQNNTLSDLQKDNETSVRAESETGTFFISNMTAAHSGQYICTAKYLNYTLMKKVDVAVIYMREPVITGDTAVEEGDTLNLTCSVESFPLSHITWTLPGSNTNPPSEPNTDLQSDTGLATLIIHNMKTEYSGRYICTAQYLNTTKTLFADVTMNLYPKIFKSSGCEVQSEVLTCVCISEAFPLPTIKWPLLKNHTKYSVLTTVSNHTVNSTVTLTVKDHSDAAVECVSSNVNGEAQKNLTIQMDTSEKNDQYKDIKKQKSFGNLDETLEMVTSQEDPLIDVGQAVEDDQTYYQEAAEEGEGAVAADKAALDFDGGPKDVEYASIDFSVLKRKSPRQAAKKQETTETEYAEIKKQVKEERDTNTKSR